MAAAFLPADHALAQLMGDPPDVSGEFEKIEQVYFVGASVVDFDVASGEGTLQWERYRRQPSLSFNKLDPAFVRAESDEFPGTEYDRDPALPFDISFVSPRTVRLRFSTREVPIDMVRPEPSVMLDGPVPSDDSWTAEESDGVVTYRSAHGSIRLIQDPWRIEFYDSDGELLTGTQTLGDPASFQPYVPFSFIRRASDLGRSTAAAFQLRHDEKLYGGGESFTRLDKRGQKLIAYLRDGMGAQGRNQYKAVPVFLSSAGYGMFVHTSTPVTFDFGHTFDQHNVIYTGDELLDIFVFLGDPKDVLTEYTAITGRSPVPPLWSFGLWMSRITYDSEEQVRTVARQLREYEIPADVLHIDTGWFSVDWQNDFEFDDERFPTPRQMVSDLRDDGFRISLWQLTYFTRKNRLWDEIVRNGYHVKNMGGTLPYEDAILDFSNPEAVRWYEAKIRDLLDLGVSVIKADFGEDAPLKGLY
ncbi:MAG: TIM-barrel domain-containing protein, partial [Bacteroidota bacterium]